MRPIDADALMADIDCIVDTMSVCINMDYCHGMRTMKDIVLHIIENAPTIKQAFDTTDEVIYKKDAIEAALSAVPRDDYYDKQIELFIGLVPNVIIPIDQPKEEP